DTRAQPPLLVFNGIGASLELMTPVIEALGRHGIGVVAFDVPGTGGSPTPPLPYRLPRVARMAHDLLHHLQIGTVDVLGGSWGGALAQEFVHQYPAVVRRLVLAATSPGVVMVPGQPSALLRLVSPRRYFDPGYMTGVGGHLYGGVYRSDPDALHAHGRFLASMIPHARLHVLPCEHLFLLSRTSEAVGLIADFLEPKMAHASIGREA